jgi:hypothetical protein
VGGGLRPRRALPAAHRRPPRNPEADPEADPSTEPGARAIAAAGSPPLTIFTSTIYPDVARIWHACIRRSFGDGARVEIFQDGDRETPLDPALFPGAALLRRGPGRRDFHEAYNQAVRRTETPYLAFIDSDVFWTTPDLWDWARRRLERPGVAAVSCISRPHRKSHGTFAVFLKADVYREVLAGFPVGFCQAVEITDPALPPDRWRWSDTGDLLTERVLAAGHEVELHHLDEQGLLPSFDTISVFRRTAGWAGMDALLREVGDSRFLWRGYNGNLVLRRLHDRLFAGGPRYDFPYPHQPLARHARRGTPEKIAWRLAYAAGLRGKARRVERFARPVAGGAGSARPAAPAVLPQRPKPEPAPPAAPAVLSRGEFYRRRRFGPETVNRGAVLMGCEWDGGRFEDGAMVGGVFRGGELTGGAFWGGVFLAGSFRGGSWEGGFDRTGLYHPASDVPAHARPGGS